jgi:pyruvate dehydrogenase E2 component (dihydrolipoyllysine-residue acetyltransferase)
MAEFLMPRLGSDMTEGTLVAWHKKPGDAIRRGEIIAEVETDKGVIEVECFNTGVVERLLVEPGAKIPVGKAMATIREEGAAPTPAAAPTAAPPAAPAAPAHVRVSPAARKRAQELGVDVAALSGSGPGGAITL